MNKRILPFYFTGWFYLALVFWVGLLSYVSNGGFNAANQLNLSFLAKTFPNKNTANTVESLTGKDVLTLHTSFDEDNVTSIQTLLLQQKTSQIIILDKPTKTFIKKLNAHLTTNKRKNKILVNSHHEFSEEPLLVNDTMFLSSALNWFRFDSNEQFIKAQSAHITFLPLLLNQRQGFPMFWQHQEEIYPSLLTELLQQLNNYNLAINQQWQLSLHKLNQEQTKNDLLFGFSGEIFTLGSSYRVDQYGTKPVYQKHNYILSNFPNSNTAQDIDYKQPDNEKAYLTSVQQFIKQQNRSYTDSSADQQYKVIILTDKTLISDEIVKPLIINLTQGNYLSQTLLTLFLCTIISVLGFVLIWLMQSFTFNQQILSMVVYSSALFSLQTLLFNHQQWLEVLPSLVIIIGTWLIFSAYHKENNLFSTSLIRQAEKFKGSSTTATVIAKHIATNQKKPGYKSPQNFSPSTIITQNSAHELDKTIVMDSSALQNKKLSKHHITVESFGRYQVEGILGKGAMGIVYQGVDPKINRHVAIKTLQLSNDVNSEETTEAKERFFREAQTAGGLSHANIVTIYDVGEENNLGYIAMDLLTGAPLSLFTQPGQTLPTPLVYQLLIQITDALEYAHKQKVVHRDIKPANIIFDDDLMKVTVTDFGIAYVSDHSKTRTGVIMGSPYYMSPEQILGLKVDGRSDIFSLGVTFYQLLSGHLPFEGESIATVAYQITKAKPIAVNTHDTKLPASALRITNKAMHKDIDKRYQSMAEFKLALVNALKRDYKITAN